MIQKVYVKSDEDLFASNYVEIEVEDRDKILCNEPYVKDAYEMYNNTLKNYYDYSEINSNLQKVSIDKIVGNTVAIQLNKKYSTTLDLTKEKKEFLDFIQENSEIDLKVTKNKNQYNVSFSNAIQDIKFNDILDSIGKKVAYKAKVLKLVHGGYTLSIDGIKVFMPGSFGGMNKLTNFDALVNKSIYVMPINYSNDFKTIVVSHREYLNTLKPLELDKIKYDFEYSGKVTGTTKFGVFVEFNTEPNTEPLLLTGLIPNSEMTDEVLTQFNSNKIKNGDIVKFYVKNVVHENKIILTNKFIDWEKTFSNYNVGKTVNCTVMNIKDNIIFTSIEDSDLIGTITNYEKECKKGDVLKLRISLIDTNSRKIFLKI